MNLTYSKSIGWLLMPRWGGAIQLANFPGSTIAGPISEVTKARSCSVGSHLASLAARLVDVQERERARYAEELHDSTAQHLVAASLNLMVLKEECSRWSPSAGSAAGHAVAAACRSATDA